MTIYRSKITLSIIITSSILLSGCASTVADVKSTTPFIYKSTQSPIDAAKCVVHNIDNNFGKFFPILNDGENKETYTIRVRSEDAGNAAIINVEPMPTGSLITTQISNHYPFKGPLSKKFTDDC